MSNKNTKFNYCSKKIVQTFSTIMSPRDNVDISTSLFNSVVISFNNL